ncbi:MAG: hypothetical protein ACOC1F_10000, partial [Myxococcota bacterium]
SNPAGVDLFDYADLLVIRSGSSLRLYRAAPDGTGFKSTDYDSGAAGTYTGYAIVAKAGNVFGDYHDELLVASTNQGFHIVHGQDRAPGDPFDFSQTSAEPSWAGVGNQAGWSIGNFSGDHRADFLLTLSTGTTLWLGGDASYASTTFSRPGWTLGNVQIANGDLVRRGYDDVMFCDSSGAYLYAGTDGGTFTADVWTGAYPSTSYDWIGRE